MKIFFTGLICLSVIWAVAGQNVRQPQVRPTATPRPTPTAEERAAIEKKRAARRAVLVPLIASEVDGLALPENRAFASARLGVATAKDDPDASKDHFKRAIAELLVAQQMAESVPVEQRRQFDELIYGRSLRPSILLAIGSADPELALDAFYRTRPLTLQKALAGISVSDKISNRVRSDERLILEENSMEQRLIRLLAAKDPEKGLALLKESIKKNLSPETLAQLREVWKADPESANSLANDVVSRLTSRGFEGKDSNPISYEMVTLATAIINDFLRVRRPDERSLMFEESGVRSLAVKLISTAISRGSNARTVSANQLETMAKRFSPSSMAAIRQMNTRTRTATGLPVNQNAVKLASSGASADTLINEGKKFSPNDRQGIYAAASQKLIEEGQFDRAASLISEIYDEDSMPAEVSKLAERQAAFYIGKGEFDAAESLTTRMDAAGRTRTMVALARGLFAKNKEENRDRAASILERTRASLSARPQNAEELRQIMIVIAAMAPISTPDAMRNFEQLIDPINQVTEASAIVSAFQKNDRIRDGEFIITNGPYFGVQIDLPVVRSLAEQDTEKSAEILRGITRRELKVSLLLGLLEGS